MSEPQATSLPVQEQEQEQEQEQTQNSKSHNQSTTQTPSTTQPMATPTTTVSRPHNLSFNSINHLKLPVHSLRRTLNFYTTVLPFTHLPQYNHYTPSHQLFACMFTHQPSNLLIEARYHPAQATAQKGWDPVTFGVDTRADLEAWGAWFDECGVRHSRVLTGIKGWLMGAEDPDGRVVRLYVEKEEHEWTDVPDVEEEWTGYVEGDPAWDE